MQSRRKLLTFLYWMPRVLALFVICFLAIFALDVFIPGKTIGYYLIALFMHLLPNFVLLILLVIAWRYEAIGGILFILGGLFFTIVFQTYQIFINFLIVSFPIFLIGILFIFDAYVKNQRTTSFNA